MIRRCTGRLIIFMDGFKEGAEDADNPAKTLDPGKPIKSIEEIAQNEASSRLKMPVHDIASLMNDLKKASERQRELKNRLKKVQVILPKIERALGNVRYRLTTEEYAKFINCKNNFKDSSSLDQYNKLAEEVKKFDFSKAKTESAETKKSEAFKREDEALNKRLEELNALLSKRS